MYDAILFSKIFDILMETCKANNIRKVNKLTVVVNHKSHVNENSILKHLRYINEELIGKLMYIKMIY